MLPAKAYHIEAPSTAINQLSISNAAPFPVQLITLEERLQEAEEVLRHLDVHIMTTQHELDRASAQRNEVAAFVQIYKKVIHPIRRIPADVLLEIFASCLEYTESSSLAASLAIDSLDTKKAPWNLGQVCQLWRTVVVGAPWLWSSITLDLPKLWHKKLAQRTQTQGHALMLLSQRLNWTKDHPLDVAITSAETFHPLFCLICSHSSRWRRVTLSLTEETLPALSLVKDRLSTLQTLYIHRSDVDSDWHGQVIDAFKYAPSLISVTTHNIKPTSSMVLPWAQLKTWTDGPTRDISSSTSKTGNHSSLALLRKCSNLVDVTMTCAGSFSPAGLFMQFVRHIHLRSLNIHHGVGEFVEQLLRAVTLPALKRLSIRIQSPERGGNIPELSMRSVWKLIQRSECSLISLRLSGFNTDFETEDSCCRELFSSTATLISLTCSGLKNSFVRGLLVPAPDDHRHQELLLPNLRELWFPGKCPSRLDQLLFVDMVQSRTKYGKLRQAATESRFVLNGKAFVRFKSLVQASCVEDGWMMYTLSRASL